MDDLGRQRLNLRAIGESLDSALRDLTPDQADRVLSRANLLLEAARTAATSPEVKREVESLQSDLDQRSATRSSGNAGE